ncbi:33069_t:CDS:2, partial [Racocetra persica]
KVLEELTRILAPFAEITQLLGGSNYTTLSFIWPAITTLTRNCTPLPMSIRGREFVDVDEELEIISTANG